MTLKEIKEIIDDEIKGMSIPEIMKLNSYEYRRIRTQQLLDKSST